MNRQSIRITLRLNRFELFAFGVALVGLAIASLVFAGYVTSMQPPKECLVVAEFPPTGCEAAFRRFNEAQGGPGSMLGGPLLLVTYAVGLFLGVPIVGRELERGTVRLAWSLSPSRWRWYLARLVPILVVLVLLTFLAGIAADQVFGATRPGLDASRAFEAYGGRGGLLAARAVFIFAVSVIVGSVIGRALPAVIVAAVVVTIGLYGGTAIEDRILAGEAVAIPVDQSGGGGSFNGNGERFIDQKFVLPDGSLVGYEYFGDTFPSDEFGNPTYPMVNLVIPGERYRFVEAREAAALLGASLVALVLAGVVVSRRRPG